MKMKSHSGANGFTEQGTGKFMRKSAGKRHILTSKNRERETPAERIRRRGRDEGRGARRLLPYP